MLCNKFGGRSGYLVTFLCVRVCSLFCGVSRGGVSRKIVVVV